VAAETFRLKIGMWLNKSDDWYGPHAYLYLVDLDNWLNVPSNQEVACNILHETRGVRKIVCRPDELKARLANAFGEPRASETLPLFEVQRMDPHCFEPAPRDFVTTVTHPFVRVADTQVWIDRLVNHPERARITALTNTLVHRVMGAEYGLWEGSWDVSIERHGRRSDIAWFMLGMGEQYGLSFCIYLAFAFEDSLTQPASSIWLGMTDALNYLDLSHFLLAMDVLRDFVVATGANAYVKTNKDDYQRLAKGKLEHAVALREAMMATPA
jgi:hypothetical protein